MELERVQHWEAYAAFESFKKFEAACLWCGFEPPMYFVAEDAPLSVRKVLSIFDPSVSISAGELPSLVGEMMGAWLSGVRPWEEQITRPELLAIAERENVRPQFLYPEDRGAISKDLHGKTRSSYRIMIAGLLNKLNIDPDDRSSVQQVKQLVQECGLDLSKNTIRKILNEAKTLSEKGLDLTDEKLK